MTRVKILIFEDENEAPQHLQRMVKALGYVPARAASIEAASEGNETWPDLVLMDIMLNEMDSMQAAQHIRNRFNMPLVNPTAHAEQDTWQLDGMKAPSSYVLKPAEEHELQVAIEMVIYKHHMERRIKESQKWLDTILKIIGDAIVTTDAEGRVTFINPSAETLSGWTQEEALGAVLEEVFCIVHGKIRAPVENPVERALREGVFVSLENHSVLVTRDGKEVPVETSAAPIQDNAGNVTGAVLVLRDLSDRVRPGEALQESEERVRAAHDPLTNIPNRVLFSDRLGRALSKVKRNCHQLALLFLDLDGFKEINDSFGHQKGDMLLKEVAQRLKGCLRERDTVARWGGDEFTLLLENLQHRQDAATVSEKVLSTLARPFELDGNQISITASIGISVFPDDGDNAEKLLINADAAMCHSKKLGKNDYQFASQ